MTIINSIKRFEAEIDIETYVKDYVDVETFQACCKACPHYNTVWSVSYTHLTLPTINVV